jgi:hypothetical protein
MGQVAYRTTRPWAWGAWRPGRPSVAVVLLFPVAISLGAELVPLGGVAVVAGAVWWLAATFAAARPTLEVGERVIRCGAGAGRTEPTELSLTTLVDLRAVTAEEVVPLLESGKLGRANLATAPFVTDPVHLVARSPSDVVAVITFNGRGKRRTRTLLPIWEPAEARPFVAAAVAATPNLDTLDDVEMAPPEVTRPAEPDRRAVLASVGGRLVAAAALPIAAGGFMWAIGRQLRALVLDPLFGTNAGLAAIAGFRLAELTVGVAAVATGLVAGAALYAWQGSGRPITLIQSWQLGAVRSLWALWQLRVWLVGTAALLAVTGIVLADVALAYAAATLAIPGVQVVREVVKRTVEEARMLHPEPLLRVARAHQWVAVVAAVAAFLWARF